MKVWVLLKSRVTAVCTAVEEGEGGDMTLGGRDRV